MLIQGETTSELSKWLSAWSKEWFCQPSMRNLRWTTGKLICDHPNRWNRRVFWDTGKWVDEEDQIGIIVQAKISFEKLRLEQDKKKQDEIQQGKGKARKINCII